MARINGWKPYDGNKTGTIKFKIYNKQRAYIKEEQEENIKEQAQIYRNKVRL